MSFIIIYITNPNLKTAKKVAAHLLKKKLIACANIFPIQSTYSWKGKVKNAKEYVAIVKTRHGYWELIKTEVQKIHPYDIPCIMKLEAEANHDYEKWIHSETERTL